MAKMHKKHHRKSASVMKRVKKTTQKVIPVVTTGLKTVGKTAKNVAVKSAPILEKGIGTIYGTLATGFDMGIQGAKKVAKMSRKRSHSNKRHNKKTRRY